MFVSAETVLDIEFAAARPALAAAVDHGVLASASGDAYGESGRGLARVGPLVSLGSLGSGRRVSRLVQVNFRSLATRGKTAALAIRWEAVGPGGGLFPVLDADLTLAPFGEPASLLVLTGAYRPPLGAAGAAADRVFLRRVAEATVRDFVNQVAEAVMNLSAEAEAV